MLIDYEGQQEGIALLYFTAPWCMPCKGFRPVMEKVSEIVDNIPTYVVDVDKHPDVIQRFGIAGVPSVVLCDYEHGTKIVVTGAFPTPQDVLRKLGINT